MFNLMIFIIPIGLIYLFIKAIDKDEIKEINDIHKEKEEMDEFIKTLNEIIGEELNEN